MSFRSKLLNRPALESYLPAKHQVLRKVTRQVDLRSSLWRHTNSAGGDDQALMTEPARGTGRASCFAWTRDDAKPSAEIPASTDPAILSAENARLVEELAEARQQQAATGEILGILSRSPADLQPVLDAVTES